MEPRHERSSISVSSAKESLLGQGRYFPASHSGNQRVNTRSTSPASGLDAFQTRQCLVISLQLNEAAADSPRQGIKGDIQQTAEFTEVKTIIRASCKRILPNLDNRHSLKYHWAARFPLTRESAILVQFFHARVCYAVV